MTTIELKEILLKEHARDKKLTYIGVFIIIAIVLIIAGLVYTYAFEYVINAISNNAAESVEQVNANPYSDYYKFVIPIAIISVLFYPILKFLKLRKRPERIDQFIAKVDSGLIAMTIDQGTIYKFTIPLIKINLRLKPIEIVTMTLDQDTDLKPYTFPIPPYAIPELKVLLSGVNSSKVNQAWHELYGESGSNNSKEVKLKSEEEFQAFLREELSSEISTQDSGRKVGKAMYKKGIIISVVAIVLFCGGIVFFNFSGVEMSQTKMFIGIGVLFGAYYLYVIIAAVNRKKSPPIALSGNNFKMKIFKPMIEFINSDFQFILHGHIDLPELIETGILESKNYEIQGNDQIIGNHIGVPFQLSDLDVNYKRNFTSEKDGPDSVFVGQVFIAKFNKSFNTELYLLPKKRTKQKLKDGVAETFGIGKASRKGTDIGLYTNNDYGKKIELEDPDFMAQFKVYGTDQTEARYILTPAMMERLKVLNNKTEGDFYVSFKNNKVSILNNSGKNNFEAGHFNSLGDENNKLLMGFYKDLCDQLSIIDDLKLNINIWNKN